MKARRARKVRGRNPYYGNTIYAVFRRRPIATGRGFIWDVDVSPKNVRIFYRCHGCDSINQIRHRVSPDGFIFHCLKCPNCEGGVFAYLEGWKGKDAILKKANQARLAAARRN